MSHVNKWATGVKMTYGLCTLTCARFRSAQENLDACAEALCILTGLDDDLLFSRERGPDGFPRQSLFEANGGRIEYYRATG